MKPRVILSASGYRIVRTYSNCSFLVEESDGKDLLGRVRWKQVPSDRMANIAGQIVHAVGRSMLRRERQLRRSRR